MDQTQQKINLGKRVYDLCYLRGEFKLRSGQISHEYFDKYRFESDPKVLKELGQLMAAKIPAGTQVLAGLEMGGIPVATAIGMESQIPLIFVRKKPKEYGTCKIAEGMDFKGKKVVVIEDVITTGGQVFESVAELRKEGAIIDTVLCVILRGGAEIPEKFQKDGLTLIPLFTADDLRSKEA